MFGWLKRGAQKGQAGPRDVAEEAARDTYRLVAKLEDALGGMHSAMTEDPFVIGTLAAHAAIVATVTSDGPCPLPVVETAMVRAIEYAFGAAGVGGARALELLLQHKSRPEYARGSQIATLILAARFARDDLQDDPLLVRARERVLSMPDALRPSFGSTEAEQVSAQLFHDLFVSPLKAKYGEPGKAP